MELVLKPSSLVDLETEQPFAILGRSLFHHDELDIFQFRDFGGDARDICRFIALAAQGRQVRRISFNHHALQRQLCGDGLQARRILEDHPKSSGACRAV